MADEIEKINEAEIVAVPVNEAVPVGAALPEASLRETDGEVYLPVRHSVEPDSEEFRHAIARCLPNNVALTIIAAREAAKRSYRRIEIIAIILLLLGVGWFVYSYFPASLPALPFKFEWRYSGPRFPLDSLHASAYREARADFDSDRYEAVLRRLEPVVAQLAENGEPAGFDELFYIYFVAAGRSVSRFTEWRQAGKYAEILAKHDPDNLGWNYFLIMLTRRSWGAHDDFFHELKRGKYRKSWWQELQDIRRCVDDLQVLRGKVTEVATPSGDRAVILKQLDLLEAELLIFQWLLEGGEGRVRFPDNKDSPGVEARERAWNLALKYQNDSEALDFYRLRYFILDVLERNSMLWNRIYVAGDRQNNSWLKAELDKVKRRLPLESGGIAP